jgi:hypothetical protein
VAAFAFSGFGMHAARDQSQSFSAPREEDRQRWRDLEIVGFDQFVQLWRF